MYDSLPIIAEFSEKSNMVSVVECSGAANRKPEKLLSKIPQIRQTPRQWRNAKLFQCLLVLSGVMVQLTSAGIYFLDC